MERNQIAYRLSQAFHPAVIEIPGAMTALYLHGIKPVEILYFAVLPIAALTCALYGILRLPKYRELNMNIQEDRDPIYPLATVLLAVLAGLTHFFGGPVLIQGLYPGMILVAIANYVINSKVKISLHLTGMGVLTAIFTGVSLIAGGIFLAASAFVAWSRITLDRHTPVEAALGFLVSYSFILTSLLLTMGSA